MRRRVQGKNQTRWGNPLETDTPCFNPAIRQSKTFAETFKSIYHLLADPGKASGCSINTVVIDSVND